MKKPTELTLEQKNLIILFENKWNSHEINGSEASQLLSLYAVFLGLFYN